MECQKKKRGKKITHNLETFLKKSIFISLYSHPALVLICNFYSVKL